MSGHRLFTLQYGVEFVAHSLSVLGGGDQTLREPIFGALVETGSGVILLDTGISRRSLDDPALLTAIYGADRHPTGPPGDPLTRELNRVGFSIADVTLAVISHLHLDHTGGIPLLAAAGIPVAIQRTELEFGRHRAAEGTEIDVAFQRGDYLDDGIEWLVLDGETELAPGVSALPTPGHTPGHQSFRVDMPISGSWVFAADAADLAENVHQHTPCGTCSVPDDIPLAQQSLHRLIDEAEHLDARLIPGHDPVVWQAIRHPVGGHR